MIVEVEKKYKWVNLNTAQFIVWECEQVRSGRTYPAGFRVFMGARDDDAEFKVTDADAITSIRHWLKTNKVKAPVVLEQDYGGLPSE